ncbi:MAG: hypothetical protein QOG48_1693 [Verrucomicrobiota bacterium]|jgi:hypothetical protein
MPKLATVFIISALAAIALWPAFQSPAAPQDEGTVLAYPELLLKGYLPYRDFENVTGPGNPLLLAIAYRAFGTSIFVERAVGMIYRLLIVVAIFGIAQRWKTVIAAASALVMATLLPATDLWANTWFAGVAFALCALWAMANESSTPRSFAAGVLAGVAVLCRHDLGLALGLASLPSFLSMNRRAKTAFIIGGIVGLAPLFYLMIALGPGQIVYSLFVFPVLKLNPGRHLSIADAKSELQVILAFHIIASVVNLCAGIVAVRDATTRARGRVLLGAAILGTGFLHYALERFDSGHAMNAALVPLALMPLSIFVLLTAFSKSLPVWMKAAAAILIAFTAVNAVLPRMTRYFYRGLSVTCRLAQPHQVSKPNEELGPGDKGTFIWRHGRAFPYGAANLAEAANKILAELERSSVPGQLFLVGPGDLRLTNYCDTYMYYLEPQLKPATYFLEMNPGSANAPGSRLARDIARADWVLLNRRWDFLIESNRSIQFGPNEPNETLRQDFDLWAEASEYLLYRNRRLRNAVMLPP